MSHELADIHLSSVFNPRVKDALAQHLARPHPDYPGHIDWGEMALAECELGVKTPAVVWCNLQPVAFGICQRSKHDATLLEVKHLFVDRRASGQRIGSLMLRRLELVGADHYPDVAIVGGSTKPTQTDLLYFLAGEGYQILPPQLVASNFGHNGVADVTAIKPLTAGHAL